MLVLARIFAAKHWQERLARKRAVRPRLCERARTRYHYSQPRLDKTVAEDLKSERKPTISGVVLVAAPESGIDALTRIFAGLPSTLAAAFIVIVPGYQGSVGKLSEIIEQASGLKTKVVEGGDRIELQTIHTLPSDRVPTRKKS